MPFNIHYHLLSRRDIRPGYILAILAFVALGYVVTLFDPIFSIRHESQLNFAHDLCVSQAYDRLGGGDISRPIEFSAYARHGATSDDDPFVAEFKKLMAAHNATASGAPLMILINPPSRMPTDRYSDLAPIVICEAGDTQTCRTRNFWFFVRVEPELAARLTFENALLGTPRLHDCGFRTSH